MRWGVGKGRFRNLTAVVLSAFLAILFLIVWQFVRRIEPLAIDNTPQASTATIQDRLLHPREDSLLQVTASNLRVLCVIADSVNTVYKELFPKNFKRSRDWNQDSSDALLQLAHMKCRQQVARVLNAQYMPFATYNYCQQVVIAVLGEKYKQALPAALQTSESAEAAMTTIRSRVVGVSEGERELVMEVAEYLEPRLQPFLIGLTGDDVQFHSTTTEQAKP